MESAIANVEDKLAATPEHHSAKTRQLDNLENMLSTWYSQTDNIKDLEATIIYRKAVVLVTPYDHPNRAV